MKKNLFPIALIILFVFGTYTLYGQEKQSVEELKAKIDTYLNNSVANGYSASVLVAKKGDVILSKGYGWSDRKKKIVNTSSSIFNIGSVTKQFTAAAILKLVEQGKLNTSDKIGLFYNEAPIDKKDITIHQLLTHTTGVSPRTGGFRYDEASKEQFLKEFFEAELQSTLGTNHQYANANYIMLAAIIELVSKQDYTTFLKENFWDPLSMNKTGYKSISFNSEQLSHGYYFNYTDGVWMDWGITQEHLPYNNNHWYSIGKGDIYSTTEDLYKWHLALQHNKVLSNKSLKMIETPHVVENDEGSSHYGYGWAIFKSKNGTKIVTHNGSNGIYFANFIRYVEDDLVVIVLSNTILNRDSEDVSWNIGNMVFDSNFTPKPVTKLSYELVYDFISTHDTDKASKLVSFLDENLGSKFNDKAVFNRIGFKRIAKEGNPAWGLELLKLNVELFPNDGNLYDSLGDAYFEYNQKENAIKAFSKALELKSENNCNWCKNSQERIESLKN
ncbi:serine hydrolase [Lutibacter flavus]|uniref:CubicO group peptidase, beta-lactamase class C family n=1 Tax=Lutibacter flavus TaxID=691689 RepID=A0A238ZM33_9FLAO|nr:serine hydrolase [Lutibacter flavus]SNR83733.1 CubicO group peptidase, beta-lactamase class C family [Lutibacter flavus]